MAHYDCNVSLSADVTFFYQRLLSGKYPVLSVTHAAALWLCTSGMGAKSILCQVFNCATVSVEGVEGSWGQANGGGEAGAE